MTINVIAAIIIIVYVLSIPAAYAVVRFGFCQVIYEMIEDITEDGKSRIFKFFRPMIFHPIINTLMLIVFILSPIGFVQRYVYMRIRNNKDFMDDMIEIANSCDKDSD